MNVYKYHRVGLLLTIFIFCLPCFLYASSHISPLKTPPDAHFIHYVENHSSNISVQEAWQLVQEGYGLSHAISKGVSIEANIEKRLRQANAVVWYFMWRASLARGHFTEGLFDLPDPQGYYWRFFLSLPGSYVRLSSHYTERTWYADHGVDIFPEGGNVLPANKRTLLFNLISSVDGSLRLYLKPEDHGVSWMLPQEFVKHTWDYLRSRSVVCAIWPRPALIPFREEYPEASILYAFEQIVTEMRLAEHAQERAKKWAQVYGYAGMVHYLTKEQQLVSSAHEKVQQFIQDLLRIFPGEDLQYRTGHEVVVQKEWLTIPQEELLEIIRVKCCLKLFKGLFLPKNNEEQELAEEAV